MFSQLPLPTPSPEPPSPQHIPHQAPGTDLINKHIHYATGQFTNEMIRAELREIQQASLGRKYARVDRRPLDPPPVVHLRLFRLHNPGTENEAEKEIPDYDEVEILGFLCTVDLFPVQQLETSSPTSSPRLQGHSSSSHPEHATFPSSPERSTEPHPHDYALASSTPMYAVRGPQHTLDSPTGSPSHSSPPFTPGYDPQPSTSADDIVHHVGDYPIRERTKVTHALVGATFVQPYTVEYQGKKSIMFVFSDLAVKIEGKFILRYRVFDIFSKPHNHTDLAIQAQCYGGVFRVYSTKEFPGLQASTELTKQLARWGVRLNTRDTERKRRKKSDARSLSPLYTGTGKRKLSFSDNVDDTGGSDDHI